MSEIVRVSATDGIELVVEVEGQGSPLVLLHGITENRSAWDPFVEDLSAEHSVIRLDFRGHGESQRVETASTVDLVGDVIRVVEELGISEPAYLGHSLGGLVATIVAAVHGARRVVCVDQRLSVRPFHELVRGMEGRLRGEAFRDALLDEAVEMGFDKVPSAHRARLESERSRVAQGVVLGLWQPLFEQSAEEIDRGVAPILSRLTAPYLAIHGEPLDAPYLDWLRAAIPHAEIETWEDDGHWLHLVEPERFLDRILPFLAKGAG